MGDNLTMNAFILSRVFDAYLSCITMPLSFIIASPERCQAIRQYFSKMYEIIILKSGKFRDVNCITLNSADINFRRNSRLRPLMSTVNRSNQNHSSSNQNIPATA